MKFFQFQSVEHWSDANRVRLRLDLKNLEIFNWSKVTLDRSKFWKIEFFEKTIIFFAESIFKRFFMTCNTWAWFHKFSKKWVFNQELQNEVFYHQKHKFCQPLNIFCIKHHKKYNLGWPIQIHTQFHVLSLAKNNLCSVCN